MPTGEPTSSPGFLAWSGRLRLMLPWLHARPLAPRLLQLRVAVFALFDLEMSDSLPQGVPPCDIPFLFRYGRAGFTNEGEGGNPVRFSPHITAGCVDDHGFTHTPAPL